MILILGVNGFIGRNLADSLLERGLVVTGVGTKGQCLVENIDRYIKIDICSENALTIIKDVNAEVIIDCITFVPPNSAHLDKSNLDDKLFSFRELVRNIYCNAKYIFLSSGGTVYGDAPGLLSEKDSGSPLSAYGIQKLMQEKVIADECKKDFYILRLSNPFGGDQTVINGVGFVSKAIECAQNGTVMDLYVPASTVRDYVYIKDVINYLILFCTNQYQSGIYNLSTGVGTSLYGILKKVSEKWDTEIHLNELSTEPKNFVHSNILCNKKLILETKTTPKYSVDDGLVNILHSIGDN